MTTFKLPEVLGGGEYEAVLYRSGGVNYLEFDVPDVGQVTVPMAAATEVKPPLPPEPDPVTVVLDRYLRAWQHVSSGRGDWCCAMDDLGADWEELNREYGPLVLLDSAPEPVELPWSRSREEALINVVVDAEEGSVLVETTSGGRAMAPSMPPADAREMARALNAAADQAEREATS